jgi:hypothetical protein
MRATSLERNDVRNLGRCAFERGICCDPNLDPEFHDIAYCFDSHLDLEALRSAWVGGWLYASKHCVL